MCMFFWFLLFQFISVICYLFKFYLFYFIVFLQKPELFCAHNKWPVFVMWFACKCSNILILKKDQYEMISIGINIDTDETERKSMGIISNLKSVVSPIPIWICRYVSQMLLVRSQIHKWLLHQISCYVWSRNDLCTCRARERVLGSAQNPFDLSKSCLRKLWLPNLFGLFGCLLAFRVCILTVLCLQNSWVHATLETCESSDS